MNKKLGARLPNSLVGTHGAEWLNQKSDYVWVWIYHWCWCPHQTSTSTLISWYCMLMYCVCVFSLCQESPDMILRDKPLISKVVLSQTGSLLLGQIAYWDTAEQNGHSCHTWNKGPKTGLLGSRHSAKTVVPGGMLATHSGMKVATHSTNSSATGASGIVVGASGTEGTIAALAYAASSSMGVGRTG
jgi:hypothetical protein